MKIKKRRKLQQKNPDGSKDQAKEFSGFLILSSRDIYNIALWAEQYYKPGKHYFFMRSFLGTTAWSHIDYDSVIHIIDKICSDKSDLSNQIKWYKLLSDAYTRISDGIRTEGKYALIRILKSHLGLKEELAIKEVEHLLEMLKLAKPKEERKEGQNNQRDFLSKIPDQDYVEYIINTIKQTVKHEDSLIRQIVYTIISKDTANPMNLAILAPASEGKTYPTTESLQYFPEKDIWKIGSMTPKVIIRQKGVLVNKDNHPIGEEVKDLRDKIESASDNERRSLKDQLEQLTDGAKMLIDLRGKLWVFFEPPDPQMWDILKPILSHDTIDMEHPYVDKDLRLGITVKQVVTRGWPACIFCSAKNEANWPIWSEIQSRYLITSPNMISQKYEAGNELIAQRCLPNLMQQSVIITNEQTKLTKQCVNYVLEKVKQCNSKNPVWIPYGEILAKRLPAEKGSDNRVTKRIFSFLNIVALTRAHLRDRLQYGEESLVIANLNEDLHEVLHITQNLSGVPPFKLNFFRDVFLPLFNTKRTPTKSSDGKEERNIALTAQELCDYAKSAINKIIAKDNLKRVYLDEFIANGLIDEEPSLIDKRQNYRSLILLILNILPYGGDPN